MLSKQEALTIALLVLLVLIFTVVGQTASFREFGIKRAMFINDKWVRNRPELDTADAMTFKQAQKRVDSIIEWSKKLNYMYPEVHYKRVAKDVFAIVELETGFVNYNNYIDNGTSFGVFSMQWSTAKGIANSRGWKYDRDLLAEDTNTQAKLAVYYYYHQLQQKKDRFTAIMSYNNPSVDENKERWRKYVMEVLGRITYHSKLMEQNRKGSKI
jgi:hypothetical protein